MPLTWLHGAGQFRAPALLHCAELPLFLLALWLLSARFGLLGAALAWLIRMCADAALLFLIVRWQRPPAVEASAQSRRWHRAWPAIAGVLAFAGVGLEEFAWRAVWLLGVLLAAATIAFLLRAAATRIP